MLAPLLPLVALSLSLSSSVAATPATSVKPLTVALGKQCLKNADCASTYCRFTPEQRRKSKPVGSCTPPRPDGHVCYDDAGCQSLNCEASKCAPSTPVVPQFTCTKSALKSLYLGVTDAFESFSATPRPYLTFNGHYSAQNSDGAKDPVTQEYGPAYNEVLTTSGPKHALKYSFFACTSSSSATDPAFPSDDGATYGQLRIESGASAGQCLTVSFGSGLFRHAACVFDDALDYALNDAKISSAAQVFALAPGVDGTEQATEPTALYTNPSVFEASSATGYTAASGKYETWALVDGTDPTFFLTPKYVDAVEA